MSEKRIARLRQLAKILASRPVNWEHEFSMRIPAEPDRDADLVLSWAADELERACTEHAHAIAVLQDLLDDTQHSEHHCGDPECPVDAARDLVARVSGRRDD